MPPCVLARTLLGIPALALATLRFFSEPVTFASICLAAGMLALNGFTPFPLFLPAPELPLLALALPLP
jgi:hypothetical protein